MKNLKKEVSVLKDSDLEIIEVIGEVMHEDCITDSVIEFFNDLKNYKSKDCVSMVLKALDTIELSKGSIIVFKALYRPYSMLKNMYPELNNREFFDYLINECNAIHNGACNKDEYTMISEALSILINNISNEIYEKEIKKSNSQVRKLEDYCEEYKKTREIRLVDSLEPRSNFEKAYVVGSYIYFPEYNPYVIYSMVMTDESIVEDFQGFLEKAKNENVDILTYIFNYYKIPNVESFRKIVLEKPYTFLSLKYYSTIFKDIDILNNLLVNNYLIEDLMVSQVYTAGLSSDREHVESIMERIQARDTFLKELISNIGEVAASQRIIEAFKEDKNLIDNTANLMDCYKEVHKKYEFDTEKSIKDNYNDLKKLLHCEKGVAHKSFFKSFEYTDKEKELSYEEGDYVFSLVKNGKEIEILQNIFRNDDKNDCGWITSFVNNKIKLVVAVRYKGEYEIYIELKPIKNSTYSYKMKNAKLRKGKQLLINKEYEQVVLNWIKEKNILDESYDTEETYKLLLEADLPF